ncbi:MAG: hypothetical protein U5S82_23505 [Gammaproteobacteria bacterium]|nr:hypothetical protein [Gammaproteobacteria bacterium]MDZ7752561.1 hypothetical protein [Gammaproteobacteria bacterium]MDZ7753196.1 hypothetical protein [Gammaproteobacteria bacterium]MDZ7753301.1 hypothetical protein [Gammaproteobacteria bacterium]MDZ7754533.1 hypothetical protein [Gammaproteobacteria bacterium]
MARHGTYERKTPAGTRIARWYCPESHTTFSLLPDHLAARLPGTLNELEHVVAVAEQAPSMEAAASTLRLDIELPGALRWIRRRIVLVHRFLLIVIALLPDQLAGCLATVTHLRGHLGHETVLMALRASAARQLPQLPTPVGFCPRATAHGDPNLATQQPLGPDPPRSPP